MPSKDGGRSIEGRPRRALLPLALAAAASLAGAEPRPGKAIGGSEPVEVVGHKFIEDLARGMPEEPGGWLPCYVELRTSGDRPVPVEITGTVTGVGNPWSFTVRRRIEVSPGAPTRTWLYLRYEGRGELSQFRGTVRMKGPGVDRQILVSDFGMGPDPDEHAVAMVMTGEHTRTSMSAWGDREIEEGRRKIVMTRTERMEEKELPDLAAGYHAVEVLLLRNPDVKALEPAQLEAIRRWTHGGGFVVLVPSVKGEIFRTSLFRDLVPGAEIADLPARTGVVPGDLFVTGPDPSVTAAGRREKSPALEEHSYTVIDPVRVKTVREVVTGTAQPGSPSVPLPGAVRLYYEVPFGEGLVGVLTLDDMTFADEVGLGFRKRLWSQVLAGGPEVRRAEAVERERRAAGIAGALRSSLTREIGVGFITLLVLVYLVVIGPGVYLVLRRMNRLPAIVWVEPLVVVAYLGIIAATAYITKGVLTRYSVVTVIERSPGAPFAVKRSCLGLFSAGDTRYRIAAPGSELLHPVGEGEDVDLDLGPSPRGPALRGFHIAQWGTATFAARGGMDWSPGSGVEVLELEPREPGGTRRVIRNRTGFAIVEGFLQEAGKDRVLKVGAIPDGGEAEIEPEAAEVKDGGKEAGPSGGAPKGDALLGASVKALLGLSRATSRERAPAPGRRFIGVIERDERDFELDRPSRQERRLDLYLERW